MAGKRRGGRTHFRAAQPFINHDECGRKHRSDQAFRVVSELSEPVKNSSEAIDARRFHMLQGTDGRHEGARESSKPFPLLGLFATKVAAKSLQSGRKISMKESSAVADMR